MIDVRAVSPEDEMRVAERLKQMIARAWPDVAGKMLLTVRVRDVDEVIRWAFGFGADARVVAPPSAVTMAREFPEPRRSVSSRA